MTRGKRLITDDTRKIINAEGMTLDKLIVDAENHKMITMFEDGLRKAALGVTTMEEVLRVIRE